MKKYFGTYFFLLIYFGAFSQNFYSKEKFDKVKELLKRNTIAFATFEEMIIVADLEKSYYADSTHKKLVRDTTLRFDYFVENYNFTGSLIMFINKEALYKYTYECLEEKNKKLLCRKGL